MQMIHYYEVNFVSGAFFFIPWSFTSVSFLLQNSLYNEGVVMAVIVWYLDLHLPMQSLSITTDVVSPTPAQGEVYNIMW